MEYTGKYCNFSEDMFRELAVKSWTPRKTPLLFGKGVNDSHYKVQIEDREWFDITGNRKVVWRCKVYQHWMSMIRRCYSDVEKKRHTYLDSEVCDEWLYFSNFKKWYDNEILKLGDTSGVKLVIDKDLKVMGNRIYSPDNCLVLTDSVNSCISLKSQGDYLLGVSWKEKNKQYQCQIMEDGKKKYLGLFTDERQAHFKWCEEKAYYLTNLKLTDELEGYLHYHLADMSMYLHYCSENSITVEYGTIKESYKKYKQYYQRLSNEVVFNIEVDRVMKLMTESMKDNDVKRVRKYSKQIELLYKFKSWDVDMVDTSLKERVEESENSEGKVIVKGDEKFKGWEE